MRPCAAAPGELVDAPASQLPRLPQPFVRHVPPPVFSGLSVRAVHFSSPPIDKTCSDVSNPPISTDYLARRGLRNGHLMTVFAWARSRQFPHLPPPEARFFDVAPESRVMAHCH